MEAGQADLEIFDVVDELDRVVDARPRAEVHRRGLLHRAVHVFVFNRAGEVFLQKRSAAKDTAPGRWASSCSGHVDSGEDYGAAARRELGEEIGLDDPNEFHALFKERARPETGMEFTWVYRCHAEGPFRLNLDEISDGRWIAPAELDDWLRRAPGEFAASFVFLWQRYRRETLESGGRPEPGA